MQALVPMLTDCPPPPPPNFLTFPLFHDVIHAGSGPHLALNLPLFTTRPIHRPIPMQALSPPVLHRLSRKLAYVQEADREMRELMAWMRQERENEGVGGAEADAEGNDEEADPDLLLALAEQAEQAASQRTPGLPPAPQVNSLGNLVLAVIDCCRGMIQ